LKALPSGDIVKDRRPSAHSCTNTVRLYTFLIDGVINMNTQRNDWISVFMNASLFGHFDFVSKLLDIGAKINLRDSNGWTAMHYASAAGHTEIVKLLLTIEAQT